MSIYATLWEIKLPKAHRFDTEWVCVYLQAVPAHIGHPSHYPEGDLYSDFLPPVVECDPKTGLGPFHRAVVVLMEGRDQKIGQQYTTPLFVLTGEEYARLPFEKMMYEIEKAMPWDPDVVAMSYGPDGQQKVIRIANWRENEPYFKTDIPT
ncbi:MAG TPA: hypothetical protein VG097_13160 [Gemmata sp.]|jgi:hypothetical protein|nr:hypothetical protein [Gemmata sp.]